MVKKVTLILIILNITVLFANSNIEDDATFFSPVVGRVEYDEGL